MRLDHLLSKENMTELREVRSTEHNDTNSRNILRSEVLWENGSCFDEIKAEKFIHEFLVV